MELVGQRHFTSHTNPKRERGCTLQPMPRLRFLKLHSFSFLFGRRPVFTVAWDNVPGIVRNRNSVG